MSSGTPLVSIVLIFLNEQRFLNEAIESVIKQTSPNWELLLVDDGSTDHSTAIAKSYAERDARIRYLEHPGHSNAGKSTSRNVGIRAARGEFLVFLDGDDVLRPCKVAHQSSKLRETSAPMVYGPTLYWYRWPGSRPGSRADHYGKLGVTPNQVYTPPTLLARYLKDGGTVPCICGLMLRREVALEVNGFDEAIQNLYEDQVFIAKVCAQYAVLVDDLCCEDYRQHPDSTSSRAIASGEYHPLRKNNPSRLAFLRWLDTFLKDKQIQDPTLARALRAQFFPFEHPRLYAGLYWAGNKAKFLKKRARRFANAIG